MSIIPPHQSLIHRPIGRLIDFDDAVKLRICSTHLQPVPDRDTLGQPETRNPKLIYNLFHLSKSIQEFIVFKKLFLKKRLKISLFHYFLYLLRRFISNNWL